MQIDKRLLESHNESHYKSHRIKWEALKNDIDDAEGIVKKITDFQVAIPSWALGTGGTRFGRFAGGGEPGSLEEKIEDIGLLHTLNKSSGAISLHIPWDIPKDPKATKILAAQHGIRFDAMNSNTFQDQKEQRHSYKFGSLQHVDKKVREQAIEHNLEVIHYGKE